jgi:hypothetical protein
MLTSNYICPISQGNYRVVLGTDAGGEVLVSGGGDFGSERWHEFQVPTDLNQKPEEPKVPEGQIPLTVVIQLDGYPEEVGWRIDRLDIQNEEVIRIPAGIYLTPEMIIVRTVVLVENELYNFHIYDMSEDGIDDGKGKERYVSPGLCVLSETHLCNIRSSYRQIQQFNCSWEQQTFMTTPG